MIKMKKIIVLFVLAFSLFFSVKTDAISIGEISNNLSAKSIEENESFNAIKGIDDKDKLLASNFYINTLLLESQVSNNTITMTDNIILGNNSYVIQAIMLFSNNKLTNYKVSLKNTIFYEFNIVNDKPVFVTLEEIDLCDIYGEYTIDFTLEKEKSITYSAGSLNEALETSIKNIGFSSIYSIIYKQNEKYLNKDVYIFTGTDTPLFFEQIKRVITINDQTDGVIDNYVIDCNTYVLDDNFMIPAGKYKFRITAIDSYGNISFQWVYVMVVDDMLPNVYIPNMTVKYYDLLSEEDFINLAIIEDDSEVARTYMKADEYFENAATTPGLYEAYMCAIDSWDNKKEYKFYINVIDDLPPVVIKQNDYFVTYPYNKLTEDEIKGLITAIDDLDGNIDNSNITVLDLDDYENNYNKYGSYRMKLIVKDNNDNSVEATVSIHVIDDDYPEISLSGYEIIVPPNTTFSRSELSLYLEESILNFSEIVKLESDYFNEDNPSGTYDLYLFFEDGTVMEAKISVLQETPVEQPIISNSNFNPVTIIIGVASLSLLAGITILGVLVYKKRH